MGQCLGSALRTRLVLNSPPTPRCRLGGCSSLLLGSVLLFLLLCFIFLAFYLENFQMYGIVERQIKDAPNLFHQQPMFCTRVHASCVLCEWAGVYTRAWTGACFIPHGIFRAHDASFSHLSIQEREETLLYQHNVTISLESIDKHLSSLLNSSF